MDDFYCTKYFFPLSSSDYESELLITKAGSLPGARARLIFQYLRKTNRDDANNVPDLAGT